MDRKFEKQPRFHPKEIVPVAPEGYKVVKFHGKPAIIPEDSDGEPLYGNFTRRQAEALFQLERRRRRQDEFNLLPLEVQKIISVFYINHPEHFRV